MTLAVEADGPHHFLGGSRAPNGATLLKRRQLRAFGWRLLSVPYWEWTDLNARDVDQQLRQRCGYLTRQLDALTADQPG